MRTAAGARVLDGVYKLCHNSSRCFRLAPTGRTRRCELDNFVCLQVRIVVRTEMWDCSVYIHAWHKFSQCRQVRWQWSVCRGPHRAQGKWMWCLILHFFDVYFCGALESSQAHLDQGLSLNRPQPWVYLHAAFVSSSVFILWVLFCGYLTAAHGWTCRRDDAMMAWGGMEVGPCAPQSRFLAALELWMRRICPNVRIFICSLDYQHVRAFICSCGRGSTPHACIYKLIGPSASVVRRLYSFYSRKYTCVCMHICSNWFPGSSAA